ncbi:coiled-coil domain-containing protein 22 homolog [Tubulanus polymorphus]|uniref:coiled-coil domain-containing protein 22 homolog n=1 Tax=Tubulanus polymorphus TaxID=672921 RepID=UPI003DA1E41F
MDEVDGIIIHSLRSVGCTIQENVESIQQFDTELIIEATVRCLRVINSSLELPHHKLPPSMSARFRVGTSLAQACTDLGYRGEVGYQTFLYSNEQDIRRVFLFLCEKLPKESVETTEEALGASALLQRAVSAKLARSLKSPWLPAYCKRKGLCRRGDPPTWVREGCAGVHIYHSCNLTAPQGTTDLTKKISKGLRQYYKNDMKYVHEQPIHSHDLASSLFEMNALALTAQQDKENEWNHHGLASHLSPDEYKARKRQRVDKKISEIIRHSVQQSELASAAGADLMSVMNAISDRAGTGLKTKGSRFTHAEKLQFAQDEDKTAAQIGIGEGPRKDTEQELIEKQEKELQDLRDDLATVTSKLENMELDIRKFTAGIKQMEEQTSTVKRSCEEKERSYKVKKRTIDLLPDAENNIAKLQAVVDSSAQRLVKLGEQWEKHRAPLIDQIRELKMLNENKMSEAQKKLEEIKELRQKMKELAEETRNKEILQKQLMSEYERMTKDVNRSAYTRRILEIIGNIRKQKDGIDRVLIDTKAIQKEINQLSGKLDRTFTVTDELIFRDAKKDESVRKAYKYLAALHENCDMLIKTVEETGIYMREIRELEDQIENENSKKVAANLERISNDLLQMKKENATLITKIKSKSS